MSEKRKILFLWLTPLFTVLAVLAANFFWLHPPLSVATQNLRQRLRHVTEVRVQAGRDTDSCVDCKKVVLYLKGQQANDFIQMLEVHYDATVFDPGDMNPTIFKFYEGNKLTTQITYYPKLLAWHDKKIAGVSWSDGEEGNVRALNYNSSKRLQQLLLPYEYIHRAYIR